MAEDDNAERKTRAAVFAQLGSSIRELSGPPSDLPEEIEELLKKLSHVQPSAEDPPESEPR